MTVTVFIADDQDLGAPFGHDAPPEQSQADHGADDAATEGEHASNWRVDATLPREGATR